MQAAAIEVRLAVEAWAEAWSRKDLAAYYEAYTPAFKGDQPSRAAWEETRASRIKGKRTIQVTITDLQIEVRGGVATASFRQTYKGDALTARSRKTLKLVERGGRWRIDSESSG